MNRPETNISTSWLKKLFYSVALTLIVEWINIYLKYGEFFVLPDWGLALELGFSFTYFVSLFWIYPYISTLTHSEKLSKFRKEVVDLVEGFSVVLATIILNISTKLIPLWVILWGLRTFYGITARFDMEAVRKSMVVNAILGLFFYYFVERERIRNQIRAEQLKYAELQKEEFRVQLQHLEDQVNPGFLFRSLETLEELIENNEKAASNYVTQLSNLYRSFLNQKDQLVTLKKEIDSAKAYYELLKVHFKDGLTISFDISKANLQLQLPPGCLHQILENIISLEVSRSNINMTIQIMAGKDLLKIATTQTNPKKLILTEMSVEKIEEKYRFLTSEIIELNRFENYLEIKLPLLQAEAEGVKL